MAHKEQREFCEKVKQELPQFFKNKKVLDIGSLDINGNNKTLFEDCDYIGIDVGEGKNVNIINVGHLFDGPDNYFDVIISTEVFEHDMFYEHTVTNIIRMLKPGGLFLFTCAAPGRPEHGTRRQGEFCAPLLIQISEEWSDYYKNLTKEDFFKITNFKPTFPDGFFELRNTNIEIPSDLYFYGIKGGSKYVIDNIQVEYPKEQFNEDIFVIDHWIDTPEKEDDLINLIKRLKTYNIPILLSGHYPVKPEIQKMVDYYLFDKNNPVLHNSQFNDFNINSKRWTDMGSYVIENKYEFHHDYAIWETMRNSFNFCKFLGKKYIHFLEYDNLPDTIQYRQTFLERVRDFDVVLYEYQKGSVFEENFTGTFIFSIKTDIAVSTIDLIKSKTEYFENRQQGWQLEQTFLRCLRKITNNIRISDYIPNDDELNMKAVWSRDGIDRNGGRFQVYLAVDDTQKLFIHLISGFYGKDATDDYLLEIVYENKGNFLVLPKGKYLTETLGTYKKGNWVRVYYEGVEVFKEFLGSEFENFKELNQLIIPNKKPKTLDEEKDERELLINFVDGPYVEIKEKNSHTYRVEFLNSDTNIVEYALDLKSNCWAKSSKKYYVNWVIRIKGIDCDFYYEHIFSPVNRKFLISLESSSLGDTLAWVPYVDKFQRDNRCTVVCSTFLNYLFIEQYPNIKFVPPGTTVNNLYGAYRIGLFFENKEVDYTKNPTNPRKEPLLKICSDILGLDFEEIRPKLIQFNVKKKKQVCIGVHSTAQCKYWNNPDGWQEVVDYLKNDGYEVILLSQEESGYMGNNNPKGVRRHEKGSLKRIIRTLEESELFIGISGGLSWVAWGVGIPTILISGFTEKISEPMMGINRVINEDVCNGCWSNHTFDPGDWNWCPLHKGTDRQFECSKSITSEMVINEIKTILFEKV